jgi:hypothetical protein
VETEVRNPEVIRGTDVERPAGSQTHREPTTLRTSTSCVATIPITAVLVRGHGAPVVEPAVAPIAPACRSRGSASTRAE